MKSYGIAGMAVALAFIIVSGCQESGKARTSSTGETCPVGAAGTSSAKGACPVEAQGKGAMKDACPVGTPGKSESGLPAVIEGTVLQALPAGRYVYVELDTGSGSVWVAATEQPVAKGDKVSCRQATLMEKFESPILKRTFDRVYFVSSLTTPRTAGVMPTNHPSMGAGHMPMHAARQAGGAAPVKVEVAPAEGGVTIAVIAEQKEKLAGKEVLLRAKVTKYNAAIMDANWLHVQDGSGMRDLVVTTKAEAKAGDTVLIRGRLERDVDVGSGYAFDLIIRNAEVTVE